jgi:hypothetical protein
VGGGGSNNQSPLPMGLWFKHPEECTHGGRSREIPEQGWGFKRRTRRSHGGGRGLKALGMPSGGGREGEPTDDDGYPMEVGRELVSKRSRGLPHGVRGRRGMLILIGP